MSVEVEHVDEVIAEGGSAPVGDSVAVPVPEDLPEDVDPAGDAGDEGDDALVVEADRGSEGPEAGGGAEGGSVPQTVIAEDGIERHLVGAARALPTRDLTPDGSALTSVPRIAGENPGPAPAPVKRVPVPNPRGGFTPVSPRGPRPSWYRGPENTDPVTAPAPGMIIGDTPAPARVPLAKPGLVTVTSEQVRALRPVPVARPAAEPVAVPVPVTPVVVERTPVTRPVADPAPTLPSSTVPVQGVPLAPIAAPPAPVVDEPVAPAPTVEADTEVPDWAAIRATPLSQDTPEVTETGAEPAAVVDGPVTLPVTRPTLPVTPVTPAAPVPTLPTVAPTPVAPVLPDADTDVPDWAAIRPTPVADLTIVTDPHTDPVTDEAGSTVPDVPASLPVTRPTLPTNPPTPAPPTPAPPTPAPLTPETPAPVKTLAPEVGADTWADEDDEDEDEFFDEAEEGTDTAAAATDRRQVKPLGLKVTDRDIHLLQFLTRYKYATYPQIAGYLDTSVNALRQRLPRMKKAGLITSDNGGATSLQVWRPTELGVKMCGLDMRAPSLSWAMVAHTLGLVDLGVRFEKAGEVVVTEREIRAADTRERPSERMAAARQYALATPTGPADPDDVTPPLYVVALGRGEAQYSHIPDMVLVREPENGVPMSVAIELELQRKPPNQWRKVLLAYKNSTNFGGVLYFTHRKPIARGIEKIAKELDMAHMVEVRPFTPAEGSKIPMPG